MDLKKAKDGSLLAKYVAALMIVIGTALIGLKVLSGLSVYDLIIAALGVVAVFGTIDINLMLEKLTGRKTGT